MHEGKPTDIIYVPRTLIIKHLRNDSLETNGIWWVACCARDAEVQLTLGKLSPTCRPEHAEREKVLQWKEKSESRAFCTHTWFMT